MMVTRGNNHSWCPVGDDWPDHRRDSVVAMSKIGAMHETITLMSQHTSHLEKLEDISSALDSLTVATKGLEGSLVGPATGRKQVSLIAHVFMILILGAALLVVVVDKSAKTIRIGPSGLEIGNKTGEEIRP